MDVTSRIKEAETLLASVKSLILATRKFSVQEVLQVMMEDHEARYQNGSDIVVAIRENESGVNVSIKTRDSIYIHCPKCGIRSASYVIDGDLKFCSYKCAGLT